MRIGGVRVSGKTVKERQENQRKIEEQYAKTLQMANNAKTKKAPKRKSVDFLASKIITEITRDHFIRPLETYPNRSYNSEKQIYGLIRHLYVKYPVPDFLYDVCRNDYKPKHPKMHPDYLLWFLALAQGQSFPKLAKPYMTAKEAHCFLSGPYNEIHMNIWWAKLRVAGIPSNVADKLIERVFKNHFFVDESGRLNELVTFYAHHHQDMDKTTLGEVNDYIVWLLANEPEFRFKGRTAASMVNLSNDWHRLMQRAKLGRFVEWNSMGFEPWELIGKNTIWTMEELTNNKELANEGRKQKHCVFGYVSSCAAGNCHIFSLREHSKGVFGADDEGNPIYKPVSELNRITVEVRNRAAVQIRGHLNRLIQPHEMSILRIWAGEKGVPISSRF